MYVEQENMMRIIRVGIYRVSNIVDGKFYIGSSKDITGRWDVHKYDLKRNRHHNRYLQFAWNKHGKENFHLDILEICVEDDLLIREQFYIDHFKPPYNMAKVAGKPPNQKGKKKSAQAIQSMKDSWKTRDRSQFEPHSEEHKAQISASMKGKNTGPRSEETKRKISVAATGRKLSDEHKRKISESQLGVPHSEETKRKIGDAHRGKKRPPEVGRNISAAKKGKKMSADGARSFAAAARERMLGTKDSDEVRETKRLAALLAWEKRRAMKR